MARRAPRTPLRALLLALIAALILAGAAACESSAPEPAPAPPGAVKVAASKFPLGGTAEPGLPADSPVTHLGRTVFPKCHRMVVATVVSTTRGTVGTDIVRVREHEVVWGDPDIEATPYAVVCGERGLAPGEGGRALMLLRLLPGGGFESLEVAPLDDPAGPARLRVFRAYLAIEAVADPQERRLALLDYLRGAVRSEDRWVRANAIREYAAFVSAFPNGLTPGDGPVLAQVLTSVSDPELKRLAQTALDRAPPAVRPKPAGPGAPSAATEAALAAFGKRFDAAATKPPERVKVLLDAAAQLDRAALPLVVRGLADTDASVREAAVAAAGETGMNELAAKLIPLAVTDASPTVRQTCVLALGHLRAGAAVDTLAGLAQSNSDVARDALFALARIRDEAALGRLAAMRAGAADERRRLIDFLLSDEFVTQERAMGAKWTIVK